MKSTVTNLFIICTKEIKSVKETLKHSSWVHFKLLRRLFSDQTIKRIFVSPCSMGQKRLNNSTLPIIMRPFFFSGFIQANCMDEMINTLSLNVTSCHSVFVFEITN